MIKHLQNIHPAALSTLRALLVGLIIISFAVSTQITLNAYEVSPEVVLSGELRFTAVAVDSTHIEFSLERAIQEPDEFNSINGFFREQCAPNEPFSIKISVYAETAQNTRIFGNLPIGSSPSAVNPPVPVRVYGQFEVLRRGGPSGNVCIVRALQEPYFVEAEGGGSPPPPDGGGSGGTTSGDCRDGSLSGGDALIGCVQSGPVTVNGTRMDAGEWSNLAQGDLSIELSSNAMFSIDPMCAQRLELNMHLYLGSAIVEKADWDIDDVRVQLVVSRVAEILATRLCSEREGARASSSGFHQTTKSLETGAQQASSGDISITVKSGAARFEISNPALFSAAGIRLLIDTSNAQIDASQSSNLSVGHDSSSGRSFVSVHRGSASIRPKSGGTSQVITSGEEVQVTNGSIAPIGGRTSKPNPGSFTSLEQYDTNDNCTLDNSEFFAMADQWVSQAIGNTLFFQGLDAWIQESNLCSSSATSFPISLRQTAAGISWTSRDATELIALHVYGPNGQEVYSQRGPNRRVFWNRRNQRGLLVPNGVYFLHALMRGPDGEIIDGGVRKLLLLR